MPRSLLATTIILCALTQPLSAQAERARRFADTASEPPAHTSGITPEFMPVFAPLDAPLDAALDAALDAPSDDRRPPFAGQVVSGFAGLTVGSAIGFGVAAATAAPSDRDMHLILGALTGALVGSAVGIHWYGRRHGFASNVAVTLLGSAIGMVSVVAIPVTVPIGGTIAYNLMRRDRTAADR